MSASEDTLPVSLFRNNVTTSKVFALCYRIGGGIMTIGKPFSWHIAHVCLLVWCGWTSFSSAFRWFAVWDVGHLQ